MSRKGKNSDFSFVDISVGFVDICVGYSSVLIAANFVLYRTDLEDALTEAISVLERKLDMKILIMQNMSEDNAKLESKLEAKDAKIVALENSNLAVAEP